MVIDRIRGNQAGRWSELQVHTHRVIATECLAAVRTFACAVDEAVLDTLVAENVTAGFDDCVFEGAFANLALEHSLGELLAFVINPIRGD